MLSPGGPSSAVPGDGRGFSIKQRDLSRVPRRSLASYGARVGAAVLIFFETGRAGAGQGPGSIIRSVTSGNLTMIEVCQTPISVTARSLMCCPVSSVRSSLL